MQSKLMQFNSMHSKQR